MADWVIDGKIGVDLTATYASTSAGSSALWPAKPGDTVRLTNNGVAMFARAQSTCAENNVVVFSTYEDSASLTPTVRAVPVTTTNAAALGYPQVGFAQTSVDSARYGWFHLQGVVKVNALVACQPKVPLYTTATAGSLDDTTVSAGYIPGLVLNTSATSASSPYAIASHPMIVTSNPV